MKVIAFILEREDVIRILRHLNQWSIVYPEASLADDRAPPLDLKLLRKLSE